MTTAPQSAPPVAAVRSRDPFLDNARFLLVVLVVVGHAFARMRGNEVVAVVDLWIYAFHMPAFVLLSGYTSRSYAGEPRQVRRLVSTLVVPYLLVATALDVQRNLGRDRPPLHGWDLLSPTWVMWFVVALAVWRSTNPLWRALRYPLAVAVALSLASGLFPGTRVLALTQVLGFLPFYVLGLRLRPEHFERLRAPAVRAAGALVALGALAALAVLAETGRTFRRGWLLYQQPYERLGASALDGIAFRSLALAAALVLTVAVLALVPHRRSWWSVLGERTLYCYLLHGFVVLHAQQQGWLREAAAAGVTGVVLVAAAGLLLALVLMSRPVTRAFRPLFEPRLTWLVRG